MTDEQLLSDAEDELRWEPRVDNDAIAVAAENGGGVRRGRCGGRDAPGVSDVADHLLVVY